MGMNKSLLAGTALALVSLGYGGRGQAATTACAGTFLFTGAIETCTVAQTGSYRVTALGARGGA